MTALPLGAGPEFDRIRAIARVLGARASGLGGDCALLPEGEGWIALSCDLSVQDVHFRTGWMTFEEIGWRAAAGALSDLAAVAAEPVGLLAAVAVPPDAGDRDLEHLMDGIGAAVEAVGGRVLGGDLSRAAAWAVDVTVVGRTARAPGRGGARPGDQLWVTGVLGGARAALHAWQAGAAPAPAARARFVRPEPRVRAGRWLADRGAHAMIDLSDGLAGDAAHLGAASGVAIDIDLALVPAGPDVAAAAAAAGQSAGAFAARGGEDYELLAALPATFGPPDAGAFGITCGLPLTRVGTVRAGRGTRFLQDGTEVSLQGWDHFR